MLKKQFPVVVWCAAWLLLAPSSSAFVVTTTRPTTTTTTTRLSGGAETNDSAAAATTTAAALLEQARALRAQVDNATATTDTRRPQQQPSSPWNVVLPHDDDDDDDDTQQHNTDTVVAEGYRLYFDIGREDGSWMDPRWGASGRRIEGSLDIAFAAAAAAAAAAAQQQWLYTAPQARLRGGFDAMGVLVVPDTTTTTSLLTYRIERQERRIRFAIPVEGTDNYGDVSIPKGALHFSIPIFGGVDLISSKEGLISVRQYGWHTGWRREESRIVGTFRMKKIDEAMRMDGF